MKNFQPRNGFRSPATLATVALAAGSGSAMSAVLTFIAPYEVNPPANGSYSQTVTSSATFGAWTSTLNDVTGQGISTVTTTGAPASLLLALSDSSLSFSVNSFRFSATVPAIAAAGLVSFNYAYSEASDPFGLGTFSYVKNGTATQITAAPGSNSVSFAVNPGDTFGFQLSGSYALNTSATITNFAAPVPEPSALVLLATGFAGIIGMRRRRQLAA